MRTPVLGSVSERGCELRTVVLRSFEPNRRLIAFHTDARSPKAAEILHQKRVQWVFYDPEPQVQLRITAVANAQVNTTHSDEVWHRQSPRTRRGYQTTKAPGTPSPMATSGLTDGLSEQIPDFENTQSGRENFIVVECRIDALDWLHLGLGTNTRAQFEWHGTQLEARWCTP